MFESTLPHGLIEAYRETHYQVFADPDSADIAFTLLIDRPCPALQAAHRVQGVGCSAFITACNPFSQPLTPDENAGRQAALLGALQALGLAVAAGVGQHPDGDWDGEPSFLVYGIEQQAARTLGQEFGQNAIVWAGADAVPRLVMLR